MREGWKTKCLEEVAYLSGRIGWKGLTAKEYTAKGPLFLSVHSLNYGDHVDYRDAFHISQARYDESPEIMLESDDILICKDGAGIGKLGIVGELPGPSTINSSLLLIRPNDEIVPKYLYHKLCSPFFQKIVQERIDGATTPHLYQREIRRFPVFVPPLPEQKRIVAILDEAFEGIGRAVANAEKNLVNARELFESYLNAVFTWKGKGWAEKKLGDISRINYGYTAKASGDEVGPKYLRITDIQNGKVNWGTVPFCEISESDHAKHRLLDGDIVFARTGATTGKSYLLIDPPDVVCASYLIRLRVHEGIFESDFLSLFFRTQQYWDAINLGISGSAQGGFNASKLAHLTIPAPPLKDQSEIGRKASRLATETKRVEEIYQQKLATLTELRQSLLQRAFSGELTAQPDKELQEAVA